MNTVWFHYMQYLDKFTDIESRIEVLGGREGERDADIEASVLSRVWLWDPQGL